MGGATLILIVIDVFLRARKTHNRRLFEVFVGAWTFLTSKFPFAALRTIWRSKKSWPLEIADFVFCSLKKNNPTHD
jgi:hypothetical protein